MKKFNLYYTRSTGITPTRVTNEAYFRNLAPRQHSFEETLQRWRAVGGTVSDFTGPGLELQTFRADSDTFIRCGPEDKYPTNNVDYIGEKMYSIRI